MKLKINNVGVIKDSEIMVSGLTVITGNNNSGKSTIGKVLCSIITSTLNLKEKALREKTAYSNTVIYRVYDLLFENSLFRNKKNKEYLFINFPAFRKFVDMDFLKESSFSNIDELRDSLVEIRKDIERIDFNILLDNVSDKYRKSNPIETLYKNKQICIEKINNLIETIYKDLDLTKFSSKKILDDLNNNFKEQIAPVKFPKEVVNISLNYNEDIFYDIRISNEKINDNCFIKNPFTHCFLINDVNIIDKLSDYKSVSKYKNSYGHLYLESYTRYFGENLNDILLGALTEKLSSFESQTYSQKYTKILESLSEVFSEEIVFIDGKYVCKNNALDVRNLATGSKLFAIIKLLLEHGKIDDQTLIVLDEPENHLHPKWQLILAKLIVMMIKELKTKFVITTHSPSFLLAIETYSKEYNIEDITNYYYSEICENQYNINMVNVNGDKDRIHYIINKPYIDISNLFETYSED